MFNRELIRKLQQKQTPFYYYDLNLLQETLRQLKQAAGRYGYRIHYALKANANDRILQVIRQFELGADCVSGNEVRKALEAGFPPEEIAFAGVGKTDKEIEFALKNNIFAFNVESIQELQVIDEIAGRLNKTAPVALRINPDLEANTHHYITTGKEENKFGIYITRLEEALNVLAGLKHLHFVGLHFHIGSQITDLEVFANLARRVNDIQQQLTALGWNPAHLNLGGGLGIDYQQPDVHPIPDFPAYFAAIHRHLKPLPGQTVHFELGRSVVGQCGSLITRVLYVKTGVKTRFAVVDAGMTELIRPALYHAYHHIQNLTGRGEEQPYDVVGPICESSDFFGKSVRLPEVRRGDLLAIRSTGAYAEVMASNYNLRQKAPAVYSDELDF